MLNPVAVGHVDLLFADLRVLKPEEAVCLGAEELLDVAVGCAHVCGKCSPYPRAAAPLSSSGECSFRARFANLRA